MPLAISFSNEGGSGLFVPFLFFLDQTPWLKASLYWGFYGIGFALALMLIAIQWPKDIPRRHLFIGFCYVAVASLWGAKLFAVFFESPGYYWKHPSEILMFWKGSTAYYGGFVGGLTTAWLYLVIHRISILRVLDICLPGTLLGVAIGSLGCWFAGCCYGLPTHMPWGMTRQVPLDGHFVFCHPTQLYQVVGRFLAFYYVWKISLKEIRVPGTVLCHGIGAYATVRLVTEIFRGDTIRGFVIPGYLSYAQMISLVMLAGCILWVRKLRINQQASS